MRAIETLRRLVRNLDCAPEIVQGIGNQSNLLNLKLEELVQGLNNQSTMLSGRLTAIADALESSLLTQRHQAEAIDDLAAAVDQLTAAIKAGPDSGSAAVARLHAGAR